MVWFAGLLLIACFLSAAALVLDYWRLRTGIPHSRHLQSQVADHQDMIRSQRRYIQGLGTEINSLKAELVALNQFEEKIRIIADIKRSPEQTSLFGVGGNIPEDIDTTIPVVEDHSSLLRNMHQQAEQLEAASLGQKESFLSLTQHLEDQKNLLASTPTIRPTDGWVTSGFGYRSSPFTGQREFHKAIDIATQKGTPVIAAANGIITSAGRNGLLGKVLVIDHGYGIVTRYGHLNKMLKRPGESVKRGDRIGLVGVTGRTTGPHLHYEVRLNGLPVNPKRYILN